ncbi:MAG TPA: hypothetical protein VNF68_12845, partial [Candidatus Baltobacteraceae bacterium]|nr:hypothetical protein [Candidatus Baltobacteraceae bacterium]
AAEAAEQLAFFAKYVAADPPMHGGIPSAECIGAVATNLAGAETWAQSQPAISLVWTMQADHANCTAVVNVMLGDSSIVTEAPKAAIAELDCPKTWAADSRMQRYVAAIVAHKARLELEKWCGGCLPYQWTPATNIRRHGTMRIAYCSTCEGLDGPNGIATIPGEILANVTLDAPRPDFIPLAPSERALAIQGVGRLVRRSADAAETITEAP